MIFKSGAKRVKGRKGIALVATLFAVAVVLILGTSFIMLAISENRAARAEKESMMALHVANSGVEMILNYMACNHADFGDSSSKSIWIIEDQSTGLPYKLIEYTDVGDPVVLRQGNGITEEFKFNISRTWDSTKNAYIYVVTVNPDKPLDSDQQYFGRIRMTITQTRFTLGQPVQFIVESTGMVYRKGDSMESDPNSTSAIATRQVQVRFREKEVIDNLMFMQNHRAYDLVGNMVPPPNANDGTNNASGVPAEFVAHGPVVIDGSSDFANETAGNLQFFSTSNVQFLDQVSINQNTNLYPSGTTQSDIDNMFLGGLLADQPSMGLPHKDGYLNADMDGNGSISTSEEGYAAKLAADHSGTHPVTGDSYVKAYWKCGDNDGLSTTSGVVGHSQASDPTIWNGTYGADPADPNDNMATNVPSDVEFDGNLSNKAPGFATYVVDFSETSGQGYVTLTKKTAYTGQTVTLLNHVKVEQFKNGLLFIEGGNVDVKGTVKGQLTVVTAASPQREAYAYEVKVQGNPNPVIQYSSVSQNQDAYPSNPEMWVPGKIDNAQVEWVKPLFSKTDDFDPSTNANANHIYIPYDDTDLPIQVDPATGTVTGTAPRDGGPYKVNGRWVWPGNSLINNTVTNVQDGSSGQWTGLYRDAEREGNAIIGGDIVYSSGSNNTLGIIAENYILLNADNVTASNPVLDLRAVLMSFDHSVQFDDVNLANKPTWISQPGMNGHFNFTGAIISQYADVEGKIDGTGYTIQNLTWDTNLKNNIPPNFPQWDITQLSNETIMQYVILSYQDKASMKVQ